MVLIVLPSSVGVVLYNPNPSYYVHLKPFLQVLLHCATNFSGSHCITLHFKCNTEPLNLAILNQLLGTLYYQYIFFTLLKFSFRHYRFYIITGLRKRFKMSSQRARYIINRLLYIS